MTDHDEQAKALLAELLAQRRAGIIGAQSVVTAAGLLHRTHGPAVQAQAHMALAKAHAFANADPSAAMRSAGKAVSAATAARSADANGPGLLIQAVVLSADLLRRYGEPERAAEMLEYAMGLAGDNPVLQGPVNLGLGRIIIGEPTAEFPDEMAGHFELAAEQLRAGDDDLLYAWGLIHDTFGMFCIRESSLAQISLDELSSLLRGDLKHPLIVKACDCLIRLLADSEKPYNGRYLVAVRTAELLRLLWI